MNTQPIYYQDASSLAELIRNREISPVEVLKTLHERINSLTPSINAMVTLSDHAVREAELAEKMVLSGEKLGPFHGVPFTVKDSIDTLNVLTQRGSPIFKGRIPDRDATSVARMKNAGGILLGKTNLPEFSYWIESDNLLSGRTNNPCDLSLTPGGSSGGESAAIEAGLSPIGLGTDLAISVRGPAAQTGIVSLKATHGSIPMTGIWPRVPRRFWHVGPMARSIRDLSLAFSVLSGPDGKDGFASFEAPSNHLQRNIPDRPLRIGWMVGPGFGPVDPEVANTVKSAAVALKELGHIVEQVEIPALEKDFALEVFNRIHVMEMKEAFRQTTEGRSEDEIYKMAKTMLSLPETSMKDYIHAEQAAERIRDGFAEYFFQYDVLLTHVLPIPAYPHGEEHFVIDGKNVDATYLQGATVPLNVTGLPGVSMRFGTSREGLPINVQIIGSWHAEPMILHVASLLESAGSFSDLHPPI
ncbi:amidase [uncultured Chryseobacterium sp.]|uniref:amidase n=1 Tax=uncultured Chryseobacterium sp. TaxID=259322 RepID=UPI0025EE4DFD|nr:amidase [uncultured Chryseobacterium sp.]